MTALLNKLFPFTSVKVAVINALLTPMPLSTKEIVIDRLIARHLPDKHLKYRPYKLNPKNGKADGGKSDNSPNESIGALKTDTAAVNKVDESYDTAMDTASKYIEKYK